ncbi:MAG: PQQ-binding-like beta-propeller repeat protein [Sedimentisphaerales bacterium]|nr:PQQ-binding-like beta-propeller repeat protein [Sedimentisphaerales bacterium]
MQIRNNNNEKAGVYVSMAILFLVSVSVKGQQQKVYWNQFRGPNGQGVMEEGGIPSSFGPEKNVVWKVEIPEGQSSPVIWDNRIFLTAAESRNAKELITLCFDRTSGTILWRKVVRTEERIRLHSMNTPTSSTPAADADHVYVYFGSYGLLCYDHAGNKVWERRMDTAKNRYGAATSPILYEDKVILCLDNDGGTSRLLAVHRDTGKTVWEQPRSLFSAGWSTPMIWRHKDGEELVVMGARRLTSYDAKTGEELWWAGSFSVETVSIPVSGEGLLFANTSALGGRGNEETNAELTWKITVEEFDKNHDNIIERDEMTEGFGIPIRPELSRDNPGYALPIRDIDGLMRFLDKDGDKAINESDWMTTISGFVAGKRPILLAIRPGARQDARLSHVVWESRQGIPEIPSMLYCRSKLFFVRDGGLVTCLEAATGKQLYQEKLDAPGQYVASPIAAGNNVIVASLRGVITVIRLDDKLDILAQNDFKEKIYAAPAATEKRLYLRTADHCYALGE